LSIIFGVPPEAIKITILAEDDHQGRYPW